MLGTNHKDYEKTFDEVKARIPDTEDKLAEKGMVKGALKKQEEQEPELV